MHETNRCRTLKFLVEKLIRAGHLRGYIRDSPPPIAATPIAATPIAAAPIAERIAACSELPFEPRPTINYILGGPTDDQYQSSRQRKKLL